ncbi:hypothetical protein AB0A76_13845 [Streptomyces exfoliatus]|uniref:Transposase n=1 Tax=Streptomyces exfoliatus TaxID=1905 RepID=A0ABV3CVL5_STREX
MRFTHRREEWLDRATANRAVRYDIVHDPVRDRWYLDASWSADTAVPPTPQEIRESGRNLLGVDLNANHLAAYVLDPHGNPVGAPVTVPIDLTGPTAHRDGRLRGMAHHQGLVVIAVDPAYSSIRGGRYGKDPLQQQNQRTTVTRHHDASVTIARRALGHRARRRPGVTARDRRIAERRATGQAVPVPRTRGTASPPRTASTPHEGGKTRLRQGDQLAPFPDLQDRSEGHRTSPVSRDSANVGPHRQERFTPMAPGATLAPWTISRRPTRPSPRPYAPDFLPTGCSPTRT